MLEERPLKSRGRSCRGKRWHLATLGLAPQGRSLNLARLPRGPGIGIVNVDLKWLGSSKARSGLGSQARPRHGLCFHRHRSATGGDSSGRGGSCSLAKLAYLEGQKVAPGHSEGASPLISIGAASLWPGHRRVHLVPALPLKLWALAAGNFEGATASCGMLTSRTLWTCQPCYPAVATGSACLGVCQLSIADHEEIRQVQS